MRRPVRRGAGYWAVLGAKVAAFAAVAWLVWLTAHATVFRVELFSNEWPHAVKSYLSLAVSLFLLPGLLAVILHMLLRDQRYRCRACGRRLIMPLDKGSRTRPMTEPPGHEYICAFGHGKLVTETWISGDPPDSWTEYGEIWKELFTQRR